MSQSQREPLFAIIIMVLALIGSAWAGYKMVKKSKVWFDCSQKYVNLLERDKCVKEKE